MRVGVTLGGTFDSLRTPWLECSVLFFFGLGHIASESHRFFVDWSLLHCTALSLSILDFSLTFASSGLSLVVGSFVPINWF